MRDQANALLHEFTSNPSLLKHALAVEAAMRKMAAHFQQDTDLWGAVGLLHDFDYERWPDIEEHSIKGAEILEDRDLLPPEAVHAIKAHNAHHGLPRDTLLAKTLFAVDELAGLVVACALVRPNRDLGTMKVKSVRKKMKDKGFARAVNRQEISTGAAELDMPLPELIALVVEALKPVAEDLGLTNNQPDPA